MRDPRITLIAALREQLPRMGPGEFVRLADAFIRQLAQDGVRLVVASRRSRFRACELGKQV